MSFWSFFPGKRRAKGNSKRKAPTTGARRAPRRLSLEELEARLAPATYIWSGAVGAADMGWKNPNNWTVNGAPGAPTGSPLTLDDLVFPGTGTVIQRTAVDDLPAPLPGIQPTFNSIAISGNNYTLSGGAITLGNTATLGSGTVTVSPNVLGGVISLDIQLGGAAGSDQFFHVDSGSNLRVDGHLSGSTGSSLTKDLTGTLTLTANNSGFTGPIKINTSGGILAITNALALGDTSNGTTVGANAQLQVSNIIGGAIPENALLNGPGPGGTGALLNVAGNNTWAGGITLDPFSSAATTLASTAGSLNITGQVSDGGAGQNLIKEGAGQIVFSHVGGNTYRGLTTINNGTLTIRDPLSLGTGGTAANGTIVNYNPNANKTGTLQLEDPTLLGFTVLDEQLTLNGPGVNGAAVTTAFGGKNIGALDNLNGNNTWAGPITLGSPSPNGSNVSIGAAPNTSLTISGIVGDVGLPSGPFNLTKVDGGQLILNNANTYNGRTDVEMGAVNVRDSRALGFNGGGGTTVQTGAALELQVDTGTDAHGRDLSIDSVTGQTGNGPQLGLTLQTTLALNGTGIANAGALHSLSGINIVTGGITLGGAAAAIGVDADPNASSDNTYFTHDYSLTVAGVIGGGTTFDKVDAGQLVLDNANTYLGKTFINQGWVTIENAQALGGRIAGLGDTVQPGTSVAAGAALHLKPHGTASFTLPENLILAGTGITHAFGLISQKGALMNLGGLNTATGDIQLNPNVGIGVELLVTPPPYPSPAATQSELTLTGSVSDVTGVSGDIVKYGSRRLDLQGDGTYTGAVVVRQGTLRAQNDTALGTATSGTATGPDALTTTTTTVETGAALELTGGLATNNGGIAAGIQVWNEHLVLNAPGQQLTVSGAFGTFTLRFNGSGPTGPLDVTSPTLGTDIRNALNGLSTVNAGGGSVTVTPAGNIYTVVFNGPLATVSTLPLLVATTTSGVALVVVSGTNLPLVNVSDDNMWRGAVSLNTSSRIDVGPNSRLSLFGPIDDGANPAGSDLTKLDTGELVLAGANTYRGVSNLNAGIVTIENAQALGATSGGTVVADGAQLQIQGSLNIAGEPLTIQGSGVSAANLPSGIPLRWFGVGPAPINHGQTTGNQPVTGRITGVAVDPSDPQVIYISAAGGGAWKTKDGGKTWHPLIDTALDALGNPLPLQDLFTGAIAVAPTDPRIIYVGTGEANNSGDSFYGRGILKSTNSGKSWTLIQGAAQEFDRRTVAKIVVDPSNPNLIYAAINDNGVNSGVVGNAGIWKIDTSVANPSQALGTLVNLTKGKSPGDATATDGTITFSLFDQYTDVAVVTDPSAPTNRLIFFALGNPDGAFFNSGAINPVGNGVYSSLDGGTTWNLYGFKTSDTFASPPYPGTQFTHGGVAKLAVAVSPLVGGIVTVTIYASMTYPVQSVSPNVPPGPYPLALNNTFREIDKLNIVYNFNSGMLPVTPIGPWAAISPPPAPNNYLGDQGDYDQVIVVDANNANNIYVAGVGEPFTPGPYITRDGGATWIDIGVADVNGNAPHGDYHAAGFDRNGKLLFGSDGGIWRLDNVNPGSIQWTDLNGNLAITTFKGITVHPTDPTIALGASQDNGTEVFNNSPIWTHTDDGDGGQIHIDPNTANVVYHVLNGQLRQSIDGGATWATLPTLVSGVPLYFPFLVDSPAVGTSRLLAGGTRLQESINQGANWTNLNAPIAVSALAAATFQGQFAGDPEFQLVTDKLANSPDPETIYISDGTNFRVTKNHAQSWNQDNRDIPGATFIVDIAVDPSNRDTVYVVNNSDAGGGAPKIFKTTTAGRTIVGAPPTPGWTDITGNLPDLPTWKVVVDPRNGNVYVGNDNGVWVLPGGNGTTWSRFGAGLPNVSVQDLVLNQSTNTLTAGTYGRSMFQLFLDDVQATSGVLRAVSGSSTWTGPIALAGNTVIAANGTQAVQNGISTAQLNIIGSINDWTDPGMTTHGNFKLTKTGQGNITFSGSNTYGGLTEVAQGALIANNLNALGGTASGTTVDLGTTLELFADLQLEPVTLSGNGFLFNGHNQGALRNVSNNNTYTGQLTLATNATIGVDANTVFTIGTKAGLLGTGNITDGSPSTNRQLTKEGGGTLVLASANTYGGNTVVNQGILNIQNGLALGSGTMTTVVLDGAQLQLQGSITVLTEALRLSGTGVNNTGAIENVGGANAWNGSVVLAQDPGFAPVTTPPTAVALGALNTASTDKLTLNGVVSDAAGLVMGLTKVGLGKVVLTNANTYSGLTTVAQGVLNIQNDKALGASGTGVPPPNPLIHDYELNGTYADALGGPPLVPNGGTLSATNYSWAAVSHTSPGDNQGLTLSNALPTPGNYSIDTVFNIANTMGELLGTGWVDLIEFKNRTADTGLYNFKKALQFYNIVTGPSTAFANNVNAELTLTRDGTTNQVVGYVNGVQQFSFIDSTGLAIFSGPQNIIHFFIDDLVVPDEVSSGVVDKIRIFNTPLTATQVQTLFMGGTVVGAAPLTGTVVLAGAALEMEKAAGINVAEDLTLNGTGIAGTGALRNVNGTNTWAGTVTLQTDNAIGVDLGTQLTVSGNVQDPTPVPVPTASLTKVGAGTLVFPNANSYSGKTFVNAGILTIGNPASLGNSPPEVQTITVLGASGTFTLTFSNQNSTQTTGPLDINSATLANDIQTKLTNLSNIGPAGGTVSVTQVANVYRVAFGGTLSLSNLQQMTSTPSAGVTATINTVRDGPEGTVVNNGGSLQVQTNTPVSTEALTLNGMGFNGTGALQNASGFNPTWARASTLGSNASIGVTAGNTLTINQPIGENTALLGLTEVGPGTLDYQAANTYTGVTQVNSGTLLLDVSPGANNTLAGSLTVGDGNAANGTATAQWQFANELPTTATVIVNGDGTMDLNDKTQTLGSLVINDGLARTGTGTTGILTLASLNMTGGTLSTGPLGSQVILTGDVTAKASATQTATLGSNVASNLAGTLSEGGTARTFTVNAGVTGSPAVGLNVVVPIVAASGSVGLIKSGPGLMQIDSTNLTSNGYGATTLNAGTLQVDGQIGNVTLNAPAATPAVLGGTGTVGSIAASATQGGTVNPGNVGAVGTLNSTSSTGLAWTPATTFFVDLTSGTSDLLNVVTGNVSLGGAKLDGTVGPNILIGGPPITILQTVGGTLDGTKFSQGNDAFVGGKKFHITYNSNSVVLQAEKMTATVSLAAATAVVYGQGATYTATVTPETGATFPVGDYVTFTFDGGNATNVAIANDGTAKYTPPVALLTVGTPHTIKAQFNNPVPPQSADGTFNASNTDSTTQTVNKAATQVVSIVQAPAAVVYGQSVTVTATISAVAPGAGNPSGPNGAVSFTVDGNPATGSVTQSPSGSAGNFTEVASITLTLSAGTHQIKASFAGDSNFLSVVSSNYALAVQQTDTDVAVAGPTSAPVYGQSATFTATVTAHAPGAGVPADGETVTFLDGNNVLGTSTLSNGVAPFAVSTLSAGTHTINVQFAGDANFKSKTGSLPGFVVSPAGTATALSTPPTPSVYGQPVTFTATVTASSPSTATPTGSVTFVVDSVAQTPVPLNASGQASITLSALSVTTHSVSANYNSANANFASSGTAAALQTVNAANTTTQIASSGSPSTFGQPVTFTATVTASSPSIATPTGSVTFVVDSVPQTPVNLNGSGQAAITLNSLALNLHSVSANFNANTNFNGSGTAALLQKVTSPSVTAVSSSANPSVFGQPVTFTATVSASNPAAGTPTGFVTFVVDSTNQAPVAVDGAGHATLTLSGLGFGTHSIGASYGGDTNFGASSAATPVSQTVNRASATTTISSTPAAPDASQAVTFTATVAANSPSTATPTGFVTFVVDGTPQPPVLLDASGHSSITVSALTAGTHTVSANYAGGTNFNAASTPTPFSQTVNPVGTVPPGTVPTGTVPPGTLPPGAVQPGVPGPITTFQGTPNEVWITQVYLDLLHKAISPGDLAFWTDQLEADVPRLTVATMIVNSLEYETKYVIGLYQTLLFKTPAPDDPGIQLQYLGQGHSLEELRAVFLSSDEYIAKHNAAGNAGAWVNAVFQDELGHPADSGAQAFWSSYLQAHTLFTTALAIVTSPEGYGQVVRQGYTSLLRRGPDAGAGFWFNALVGGARDQDVIAGLVSADEYFSRLRPNHDVAALQAWVGQMYKDVLGHTPSTAALGFWTDTLQRGASRLDVVEQIVNSDEYRFKLVNDTYEQILHRAADGSGLSAGVQLLQSGGTAEQLKASLMGSAEYYFARGGGTDGGFVTAVLSDALSEPAAQAQGGLPFWGPQLATTSRSGLALQILDDGNAEKALVQNLYFHLLRRDGGGGLDYWAGQIQGGHRDEDVVAGLAASREYYAKAPKG